MNRKNFLKTISGGLLLAIPAFSVLSCGSDDSGPTEDTSENCLENGASASTITANHGHSLAVPKSDVAAGVEKTYTIQGTSGHSHNITVTAAQFGQLALNNRIQLNSTAGGSDGHSHNVTITCS